MRCQMTPHFNDMPRVFVAIDPLNIPTEPKLEFKYCSHAEGAFIGRPTCS